MPSEKSTKLKNNWQDEESDDCVLLNRKFKKIVITVDDDDEEEEEKIETSIKDESIEESFYSVNEDSDDIQIEKDEINDEEDNDGEGEEIYDIEDDYEEDGDEYSMEDGESSDYAEENGMFTEQLLGAITMELTNNNKPTRKSLVPIFNINNQSEDEDGSEEFEAPSFRIVSSSQPSSLSTSLATSFHSKDKSSIMSEKSNDEEEEEEEGEEFDNIEDDKEMSNIGDYIDNDNESEDENNGESEDEGNHSLLSNISDTIIQDQTNYVDNDIDNDEESNCDDIANNDNEIQFSSKGEEEEGEEEEEEEEGEEEEEEEGVEYSTAIDNNEEEESDNADEIEEVDSHSEKEISEDEEEEYEEVNGISIDNSENNITRDGVEESSIGSFIVEDKSIITISDDDEDEEYDEAPTEITQLQSTTYASDDGSDEEIDRIISNVISDSEEEVSPVKTRAKKGVFSSSNKNKNSVYSSDNMVKNDTNNNRKNINNSEKEKEKKRKEKEEKDKLKAIEMLQEIENEKKQKKSRKKKNDNDDDLEDEKENDKSLNSIAKIMDMNLWDHSDGNFEKICKNNGKLDGFSITLLPHQIHGVNWMYSREKQKESKCTGGILADDMGLGKTIQTIGIVLANPSKFDWKSTLIVCTLSTVAQWEQELADKVNAGRLKVCLYYGSNRTQDPYELAAADVVLTTYGIVGSEFTKSMKENYEIIDPKLINRSAFSSMNINQEKSRRKRGEGKAAKKSPCCLYQIKWWRIVLDEAHIIKNKATQKHKAMCGLYGKHRWCLSGTPIQNSLDDIWSLLNFIRVPNCETKAHFAAIISKMSNPSSSNQGFQQLQELIKSYLLRREKTKSDGKDDDEDDEKDKENLENSQGKIKRKTSQKQNNEEGADEDTEEDNKNKNKIAKLPPLKVERVVGEFTRDETLLYDALFRQAQNQMQDLLESGTAFKNAMVIFEIILRLRQCCDHPYLLIQSHKLKSKQTTSKMSQYEPSIEEQNMEIIYQLNLRFANTIQILKRNEEENKIEKENEENNNNLNNSLLEESMEKDGNNKKGNCCPICLNAVDRPLVTPCSHTFCRECIVRWIKGTGKEAGKEAGKESCPLCRSHLVLSMLKKQKRRKSTVRRQSISHSFVNQKKAKKSDYFSMLPTDIVMKILSYCTDYDDIKSLSFVSKQFYTYMQLIQSVHMRSTKLKLLLSTLNKIKEEEPRRKSVIFSQFTSFLDVVQLDLNANNIKFARLDGSMTLPERQKALRKFKEEEDVPVILISLKAGACGLNLTEAEVVFILDPWWNPQIEQQAIDRVYRIGQTKPVTVYKFIVKDSIEERLLSIQEKKLKISNIVLGDNQTARTLTKDDLISLFE